MKPLHAYAREETDLGIDVTEMLGSKPSLSETDVDRIAAAVVSILETRAWSAVTAANARHDRNPTPKNKGKVVAAFNRFANLVGGETI